MRAHRRKLLAGLAVFLAICGLTLYLSQRQRTRAISHVERLGGSVTNQSLVRSPFYGLAYRLGVSQIPLLNRSFVSVNLDATAVSNDDLAMLHLLDPHLISLRRTAITDEGVRQLSSCPNLGPVFLDGTAVTNASLEYLLEYPRLSWVGLLETSVTSEGVEKFKAARPEVRVDFQLPGQR